MSLKIGTNLDYQGHDFLDSRQGLPQSLEDLKNWNILVPLGFEACVSGEWYMYKGADYWNEETGHWEKRAASMGTNYDEAIAKLMAEVFPATFSVSGGGTFEKGQSTTPRITWTLKKEGVSVPIDKVWIDNTLLPDPNVSSWSPTSPITATHTYQVKVQSSEGAEFTGSARYSFSLKRYWGVVSNSSLTPNLGSLESEYATTWIKDQTIFDCSGGKYPIYIIPANLYDAGSFQIWIGGLRNTNFSVRIETLRNMSGSSDSYAVITLNTRQTGVLGIKFINN